MLFHSTDNCPQNTNSETILEEIMNTTGMTCSANPSSTSRNAVWSTLDPTNIADGQSQSNTLLKFSSLPNRDLFMQIDTITSQYQAPVPQPRSILKKKQPSRDQNRQRDGQAVSFCGSVDVRVSLADAPLQHMIWYTKDELRIMRATAMNRRSPLRHSDVIDTSNTLKLQQHLLLSPPPATSTSASTSASSTNSSDMAMVPRVNSANAELNATPVNHPLNPQDIRYQKLVSEMDREVYVSNDDRRNSTRRRLHHYCRVLDEIDRQVDDGYMMLNVFELARVSEAASGDAMARALDRGRKEATIAKAIALVDGKRI